MVICYTKEPLTSLLLIIQTKLRFPGNLKVQFQNCNVLVISLEHPEWNSNFLTTIQRDIENDKALY